jgi:peptidoglycan/xylan/chitin deacetylase (PgdA/CDA1 family)
MATLTPAAADDKACSNENLRLRFAFPGEASDVMENYFQRDAKHANLSRKFKLYYRFRPWIPIPVRQLLQRGRNRAIETTDDWFLPLAFTQDLRSAASQNHDQPLIHPWPDNHEMAVCLTHDVETQTGVGLVDRLAKLEESLGYRSAWNFIPHKYKIDPGLITDLQERGHEICVHGYNHDGRLFESKRTFTRRSQHINAAMQLFKSKGFRAPMVHRNLQWMQHLNADYDASCFDIDPFQAMPGGIGSMWPFIVGKLVELPYTMPQDHTLLVTLGETTPRIWIEKLSFLRQHSAMALMITHPDYLNTDASLRVYHDFLIHLSEQQGAWSALPWQIANWWRQRDAMQIQHLDISSTIQGAHAERARLTSMPALFINAG